MAKPSIQNINTTQTFQNWFDKTNEMVNIFRDAVVTASVSGDTTVGNATIDGNFEATNLLSSSLISVNNMSAYTAGQAIAVQSPMQITTASQPIGITLSYAASGGRARFTNGAISWDAGMEDSTDGRFIITTGAGSPLVSITTTGQLESELLNVRDNATIENNLTVNGTIYGDISSNNITMSTGGTINGTLRGKFYGDIYNDGDTKILESGQADAGIPGGYAPATFTGNVTGTVSSLLNHTTKNLAESATASVTNKQMYFTNARAQAAFASGTGVTFTTASDITTIKIGQAVATTSDVTFKSVTATGNITAFGTISDMAMKENIMPIDNALEKVSKLGGYLFNYKNDKTPMTGVMAQELLEVLPEAVYKVQHPETNEEVYAVRHGNIIGLLIEAIKELQEKVGK